MEKKYFTSFKIHPADKLKYADNCLIIYQQDKYHAQLILCIKICMFNLRNRFDIWNVHGIMNSSSLLQSKFWASRRAEVFMIP